MSQVLSTRCADSLGKMAAQLLVELGHRVVLHALNAKRTKEAFARSIL
jgi:hypothetical protein